MQTLSLWVASVATCKMFFSLILIMKCHILCFFFSKFEMLDKSVNLLTNSTSVGMCYWFCCRMGLHIVSWNRGAHCEDVPQYLDWIFKGNHPHATNRLRPERSNSPDHNILSLHWLSRFYWHRRLIVMWNYVNCELNVSWNRPAPCTQPGCISIYKNKY